MVTEGVCVHVLEAVTEADTVMVPVLLMVFDRVPVTDADTELVPVLEAVCVCVTVCVIVFVFEEVVEAVWVPVLEGVNVCVGVGV